MQIGSTYDAFPSNLYSLTGFNMNPAPQGSDSAVLDAKDLPVGDIGVSGDPTKVRVRIRTFLCDTSSFSSGSFRTTWRSYSATMSTLASCSLFTAGTRMRQTRL